MRRLITVLSVLLLLLAISASAGVIVQSIFATATRGIWIPVPNPANTVTVVVSLPAATVDHPYSGTWTSNGKMEQVAHIFPVNPDGTGWQVISRSVAATYMDGGDGTTRIKLGIARDPTLYDVHVLEETP
jgi:hypothetical protein